jgi:hypothetical protein
MKSLKGEADLFELRPKQGRSAVRPIYCRSGQQFLILAKGGIRVAAPLFGLAPSATDTLTQRMLSRGPDSPR